MHRTMGTFAGDDRNTESSLGLCFFAKSLFLEVAREDGAKSPLFRPGENGTLIMAPSSRKLNLVFNDVTLAGEEAGE